MRRKSLNFKITPARAFIVLMFVGLTLMPRAHAVVPPPDGGYPGGNTAEGQTALFSLTTGSFNTAVGFLSLRNNATAAFNTAIGAGTLLANTANNNTATGAGALLNNTIGDSNTAHGVFALISNAEGAANTANGEQALFNNTSGNNNTAIGGETLQHNTIGNHNTAIGFAALRSNTTGSTNIALGSVAGINLTNGDNNIDIGNQGGAGESNTIRIGSDHSRTFIAGIFDAFSGFNTVPVMIDAAGQLQSVNSSCRFKNEIQPMDNASQAILALKPVTFHYKSDKRNTPQFGLIAEEVAEVNPDLVVHDKNGEIYTVRYDAVNAMLLNEFLKEHRTVQELKREIAGLSAKIKEQDSRIEKVNDLLELSKGAPRTIASSR